VGRGDLRLDNYDDLAAYLKTNQRSLQALNVMLVEGYEVILPWISRLEEVYFNSFVPIQVKPLADALIKAEKLSKAFFMLCEAEDVEWLLHPKIPTRRLTVRLSSPAQLFGLAEAIPKAHGLHELTLNLTRIVTPSTIQLLIDGVARVCRSVLRISIPSRRCRLDVVNWKGYVTKQEGSCYVRTQELFRSPLIHYMTILCSLRDLPRVRVNRSVWLSPELVRKVFECLLPHM
jgi:hypothetical protein